MLHPASTYMLRDAGGSLWGALCFAFALFTPGYCVGYVLDFCGFRAKALCEQMAWSLVLSFGACTLPLVAVVWLAGIGTAEILLVLTGLTAIALFIRHRPVLDLTRRETWVFASVVAAWTVIVVLSLIDIGFGSRLHMSVTSYDHALRTVFVQAVMRTGVPPINPLYWPGHDALLRYYYFWYVTCAVVARLAHISARQAFIASCVWPPLGLSAMLALYGRYLLDWRGSKLRRNWRLACALFTVTGLDLLVIGFGRLGGIPLYGDMEWWSIDQVTSWLDTFLWVPHHAAALLSCTLCLLLLWKGSIEPNRRMRFTIAAVAGLSFAGAFGLSTYVAFATFLIVAMWFALRLLRERSSSDQKHTISVVFIATLVALISLAPYLAQLLHREVGTSASSVHVLSFGIRQILSPSILLGLGPLQHLQVHHPFAATQIAAALLLLIGYPIELGFFAAVFVLMFRHCKNRSEGEKTLLLWTFCGLLISTILRSTVITTNDFGMRSILLPQFFLLLLAVLAVRRSSGAMRKFLMLLAIIGVCGSIYQGVMLRAFLPWHEAGGDPAMRGLAERNYDLREAYAALQRKIPANARVQYDPSAGGYFVDAQMLHVDHQIIAEDEDCNTSFGGDVGACPAIQTALGKLFPAQPQETASAEQAVQLCRTTGIQYLVATRWDTVWQAPTGWAFHLPAVVEQPNVRIVACSLLPVSAPVR